MENRNGLLVDFRIDEANGRAERADALAMLDENLAGDAAITLGADKGYDTRDFVAECRDRNVVPHVAQKNMNTAARDRRAHDAARRVRDQPAHPQTRRRDLRLDEDRRQLSKDSLRRNRQ